MAASPQPLDFDLQILTAGDRCLANVIASPAGEGKSEFALDFTPEELSELFRGLGQVRKRSTRGGASPEALHAQDFGRRLFDTVFSGPVRDRLRLSLGIAQAQGAEFRLRLRLDEAALLDLPWELLFDDGYPGFLALDHRISLIRHLPVQQAVQALSVAFPLNVLVVMASPKGPGEISYAQELRNLQAALKPLIDGGRVQLHALEHATVEGLRVKLKEHNWHVLHFIGHGEYDPHGHEGRLLFENADRSERKVGAGRLGDLLLPHDSLRLVVLNACEGGRSSREDSFAGVAQTLVQKGVPAVVAMQFPVTDEAAIDLASEFYRGIAEGLPVERSLAAARREVNLRGEEGEIEWATPVLYMRGEGRLFELAKPPAEETLDTPVDVASHEPQRLRATNDDEGARKGKPLNWRVVLLTATAAALVGVPLWLAIQNGNEPVSPPAEPIVAPPPARVADTTVLGPDPAATARTLILDGPKPLYKPYRTGDVFQECEDCPEMVVIAPDKPFTIGSPISETGRDTDEGPFGPIRFAAPYALGRFEVTRAQFAGSGVAGEQGCYSWIEAGFGSNADDDWRNPNFPDGFKQGDDHPVVCVNWHEAQAFLKWLNTRRSSSTSGAYRLPSEAEWEYAARGDNDAARFWGRNGSDACQYANVADSGLKKRFLGRFCISGKWPRHRRQSGGSQTTPISFK